MGRAIFLSYRRADTSDVVGRVNDALVGAFGESQIFRDVDSIPMGADFAAHIGATLKRCRIVLAFIGPDWADVRDEQGRRRLDDPNDLVRVELETALETPKLLVVPILVNGARMPNREELPISLRDLTARNAASMRRDPDFRADMGRLVDALRAHLRTGRLDLSALGGVATRAAGISGAAVATWLALAGVVGVASTVPEVREPLVAAVSSVIEGTPTRAPVTDAPEEIVSSIASPTVSEPVESSPTATPIPAANAESQPSTRPAAEVAPTPRAANLFIGLWRTEEAPSWVTWRIDADGSFLNSNAEGSTRGSWVRDGDQLVTRHTQRILDLPGTGFTIEYRCQLIEAIMECAAARLVSADGACRVTGQLAMTCRDSNGIDHEVTIASAPMVFRRG